MIPLFVVAGIALAAMCFMWLQSRGHTAQLNAVLAAQASERYSLARERWDLNTRITAPEIVRAAPPAPPADTPPLEVLQALNVLRPQPPAPAPVDEDDVDESFLVGTGPDGA